ncbi:TonB-dependent receptor [Spirochaetia bacterium]|nr:TonB-dependent receptor [Spirochaetia bacterium]
MLRMRSFIALGIVLMLPFWSLLAREIAVTVEDADLQIPLEGAVVRSWDGEEFICDENGTVRLDVPGDRQVVIRIAYPGYENGRLVIPLSGDFFTIALSLSGVMENRELVIEARRPDTSETKSGRSVAISGEALSRTAEIGIIEDVMTSVKLLPGVGYTGMFNAMPSIRGGEPGDLTAVLDGYYVQNPYHWGGGFSIFDPRMVESARLSHGVFSTRYSHTISGLLEITSRKPSPDTPELELGLSTSAANLNLSFPLWGKGGVMIMGKVTYYEPFIWAAQAVAGDILDEATATALKGINTAPYIRSTALSGNYRFNTDLELRFSGFLGSDGVGVTFKNKQEADWLSGNVDMNFDWVNTQGFFLTGLTWNPAPSMVLKSSLGAGFTMNDLNGSIVNDLSIKYTDTFINGPYNISLFFPSPITQGARYFIDQKMEVNADQNVGNIQGRVDFDWDLGSGFLLAAGIQELYSQWSAYQYIESYFEGPIDYFTTSSGSKVPWPGLYYGIPYYIPPLEPENSGFTSSAYTLLEYKSSDKKFGAEAGLRLDHFYMKDEKFTIQSYPAYDYRSFNPRINLDYNILKDYGALDSLDVTLGSGLFSSLNDTVPYYNGTEDLTIPFNRSWTTVGGIKLDFSGGWTFNIEGYYKKVFDRTYVYSEIAPGAARAETHFNFDGEGAIWGFDLMLQKLESRYWDGWLSYTFNYSRYRGDKESPDSHSYNNGMWYYPYFHRFHTLNVVMNIKPLKNFNIAIRAGMASGQPLAEVGKPSSYPVQIYDENGDPVFDGGNPKIIEKWKRSSEYSDTNRTDWSFPLDVKLSWFYFRGKCLSEFYLAVENLSSLFYKAKGNVTFNTYTGQEDTGSDAAAYELPIPMISIGFKWSY